MVEENFESCTSQTMKAEIRIEPNMLPVGMDNMIGNNADNARLDIP